MPLDKLVLILVCVVAAAAVTVWGGTLLLISTQLSPLLGLTILSVLALLAYIVWRVIAERVTNKDDNHYDRFEN